MDHGETVVAAKPRADEVWSMILNGRVPGLRRFRQVYKLLPGDKRCKNCYVPLSGFTAPIMRLFGRRPYHKNPHFCNWCMWLGQVYPGGTEIELSLLFADVRGSTQLAETMSAAAFSQVMNRFYDAATNVLVRTDAFIDKLVGDEVIGFYIPGYAGRRHARKALLAAQRLGRVMGYGTPDGPWLPIGIGVHTGVAYVGTVHGTGGVVTDFTALGEHVNIAARLVARAEPGEALISDAAYTAAGLNLKHLPQRQLELKGKAERVGVHVLKF
jgi:adenylate cyclase